MYLAITQGTAEWLQSKPGVVEGLTEVLLTNATQFRELEETEFAEGPIRIAATPKREVIALWNTDYLTGTGEESWGFMLIDSDRGLLGEPEILREVVERSIYVINQRLQHLLIDGAFIHRAHGDGIHTLLAGRGTKARRYSIGYFEDLVEASGSPRMGVLCVGPVNDPRFTILANLAAHEAPKLPRLLELANTLAFPKKARKLAGDHVLERLRARLAPYTRTKTEAEFSAVQVATSPTAIALEPYKVQGYSYRDWTNANSPLTEVQRRILESDPLDKHPLRIIGPAGSGKTLLMQLLAIRVLHSARSADRPCRILYVVHSAAMREKVRDRFRILLQEELPNNGDKEVLDVSTLADYGREELGLEIASLIDTDASEAKAFQLEQVTTALQQCLSKEVALVKSSALLSDVCDNPELQEVFARLVMAEISIAIKGHGLTLEDRKRYVESEFSLSRLHGALSARERQFVYCVFAEYHRSVFETYQVLDSDDVALSLLGRLRTPLWQLKRKVLGYDYIFVDETQLFNENERRIFSFLTRDNTAHVPIALALDEAQQVYGQTSAGLATLGIKDITNESLPSIHRSTRSIVQLAFFVIQRCTQLFNADFPDFTRIGEGMLPDDHPLAQAPRYRVAAPDQHVADLVVSTVHELRHDNFRQIAVVCHAEQYWEGLRKALSEASLPLYVLEQRGEKLPLEQPLTALARPEQIGGQEFDAVILVGLEQGIVPPRVGANDSLAAAVEQQALREIYLTITRARYAVVVALSYRSALTPILREAANRQLLARH